MSFATRSWRYLDGTTKRRIDELLNESPQRNPYKRFTILTYQLADVGRCMRYMEIYPDDRDAYQSHLKTALADTLVQTITVMRLYGFEPDELMRLGVERLTEFKKKGRYEERD